MMTMTDSHELLAEYATTGSEAAFRELVTSYLDLVYSAAVRLVDGDTHRAEDVAQTVFIDLARRAQSLSKEVMLGGWLHRHTCFVAANLMRAERRRQSRERQAVEMNALQDHPEASAAAIAHYWTTPSTNSQTQIAPPFCSDFSSNAIFARSAKHSAATKTPPACV
jgi:RNA polymerase sigma factor (sigma-70 family)